MTRAKICAVVLSEDKAQDKGMRIIVVYCYYYYTEQNYKRNTFFMS